MRLIKLLMRGLVDRSIKQRIVGAYGVYALARRVVAAYENHDVDMATNGEGWLAKQLANGAPVTAVDVGANRGEWANALLKHAPEARLLCFEPVPATFATLQASVCGPNVELVNKGLSSKGGTMTIYAVPDNPYIASVYDGNFYDAGLERQAIELEATTGDEVLKQHALGHVDIVKVDAEGHDFDVLLGFRNAIEQEVIDFIQFEYNIFTLEAGRSLYHFFDLLSPHYILCRLLPQGLEACGYNAILDSFGQSNWVAVRKNILDRDLAVRLNLRRARGLPGLALEKALLDDARLNAFL